MDQRKERTWYGDNGDRFEGEWKMDNREGKAIYYYKSGNRYEGDIQKW